MVNIILHVAHVHGGIILHVAHVHGGIILHVAHVHGGIILHAAHVDGGIINKDHYWFKWQQPCICTKPTKSGIKT